MKVHNLMLEKEIDESKKDKICLRSKNVDLSHDLHRFKGSPSLSLMRLKMEEGELVGNSSSFISDGCLYFDVANCILFMLEEISMYVNYVDTNLHLV
jgi:hypothetical protein